MTFAIKRDYTRTISCQFCGPTRIWFADALLVHRTFCWWLLLFLTSSLETQGILRTASWVPLLKCYWLVIDNVTKTMSSSQRKDWKIKRVTSFSMYVVREKKVLYWFDTMLCNIFCFLFSAVWVTICDTILSFLIPFTHSGCSTAENDATVYTEKV